MSEKSERTTLNPLILSAGASPAKTLAQQENEQASPEADRDCGQNTRASFASYDPDSSSWRTSQRCVFGGWGEGSGSSWPRAGMMQSGTAYPLPPSVPLTAVTGSFWLPTPTARQYGTNKALGKNAKSRPSLDQMAKKNLWPDSDQMKFPESRVGLLCPEFVETIMGFPIGWTECDVLETP